MRRITLTLVVAAAAALAPAPSPKKAGALEVALRTGGKALGPALLAGATLLQFPADALAARAGGRAGGGFRSMPRGGGGYSRSYRGGGGGYGRSRTSVMAVPMGVPMYGGGMGMGFGMSPFGMGYGISPGAVLGLSLIDAIADEQRRSARAPRRRE